MSLLYNVCLLLIQIQIGAPPIHVDTALALLDPTDTVANATADTKAIIASEVSMRYVHCYTNGYIIVFISNCRGYRDIVYKYNTTGMSCDIVIDVNQCNDYTTGMSCNIVVCEPVQ